MRLNTCVLKNNKNKQLKLVYLTCFFAILYNLGLEAKFTRFVQGRVFLERLNISSLTFTK